MITEAEKWEIRTAYRDARDKNYQITIEAQLHCTSRDHICEILDIQLEVRPKEDMKRKLYDMDWDDTKIASYLRLSPHTILDWRNRNKLPQAGKTVACIDKEKRNTILLECYYCGLSDKQSADRAGCSKSAANDWRNKNGLPCVPSTRYKK